MADRYSIKKIFSGENSDNMNVIFFIVQKIFFCKVTSLTNQFNLKSASRTPVKDAPRLDDVTTERDRKKTNQPSDNIDSNLSWGWE